MKNTENDVLNKIKSCIGNEVSFKYPGDEGSKLGVLKDRAVIAGTKIGTVPYWDVVDLIEFKGEKESQWIRIGYYRKPATRIYCGANTPGQRHSQRLRLLSHWQWLLGLHSQRFR